MGCKQKGKGQRERVIRVRDGGKKKKRGAAQKKSHQLKEGTDWKKRVSEPLQIKKQIWEASGLQMKRKSGEVLLQEPDARGKGRIIFLAQTPDRRMSVGREAPLQRSLRRRPGESKPKPTRENR